MTQRVREIVADHRDQAGALLPVLHAVQAELGCVDRESVAEIAHGLNLSRAEVHGVVTFYRDFHEQPRAGSVVRICRAEACQAVGADALLAHAAQRLGSRPGAVCTEPVSCLGNCALGPSVEVGGRLVGRVDAARLDAIMEQAR